jgi:putative tryptophan/tyrosine transport system substrate-binding protein
MRRRAFITLLAGAAAWPLATRAQQTGKIPRIAFLSAGAPLPNPNPFLDAFLGGLRALGYVDGKNIAIEYRYAAGDYERLQELAAELARQRVDIILASSTPATVAAKQATDTIPIVMTSTFDARAVGLIVNLRRPGGNITGLTELSLELIGKRLELLGEVVPGLSRLGFLTRTAYAEDGKLSAAERNLGQIQRQITQDMDSTARQLGINMRIVEAVALDEIHTAFAALTREQIEALYVLEAPSLMVHRALIAELALQNSLPTMSGARFLVDAGGLVSYGADLRDSFRRAASYVDQILKGSRPGELPVEQPTRFELIINLRTAKVLGLTVPPTLLARADEVIE